MALLAKGQDQGNSYVYTVILDDDELLAAIRYRLSMADLDRIEHAVAEGALTTLALLLPAMRDRARTTRRIER